MQTTTLPIQISGASASASPPRPNPSGNPDGAGQFSQALSREVAQRQNNTAAAAPVAAKQATPAKQQASEADNAPASSAAAKEPAEPGAGGAVATDTADGEDADQASSAAATPVADMLALVASFNQPLQNSASARAAADATVAAGERASAGLAAELVQSGIALKAGAQTEAGVVADPSAQAGKTAAFRIAADGSMATEGGNRTDSKAGGAANAAGQSDPAQFAGLRAHDSASDPASARDGNLAAASIIAPAQQAALGTVPSMNGAAGDRIAARVGTPGWDNQVGQRIVWMVAGKEQSASLTLNPPDLGPMQVVLSVTNDQASVTFSSAQPEVRQALENAMSRLREMMSETGISLGSATVNAGQPDQRQAQGEPQRGGASAGRFDTDGGASDAAAGSAARRVASGDRQGLVDTFA
jgi:flagellar hook-length control protein FliK